MSYQRLVIEADGASRGNPGDAAGGAVVIDPETGAVIASAGVLCGVASNNVAEYRGMIEGVKAALEMAGICRATMRLPMVEATDEEKARIAELLGAGGVEI